MSNNTIVFTRKALREIAPDLTRKQEDAIIDLYITAVYRFKSRVTDMEAGLETIQNSIAKLMR